MGYRTRWTNWMLGPVSILSALPVIYCLTFHIEQRLQNMQFQLTDAIYSTVIQKDVVNSDVQNKLLSSMSTIYQLFLSIRTCSCISLAVALTDKYTL